jgi:hypothetical protein
MTPLLVAWVMTWLLQQPALISLQGPSLQGIVVKESGEPLSKVTIELRAEPGDAQAATTLTDAEGTFVLWNVPAGRYRLVATRPGYARTEYGQRTVNGLGQTITLGAGEQRADLRLVMTQTASIAGRILDRSGQPRGNASVQALRASYTDGRRELTVVQSARTNDLGEYRLFWLTPGEYYVGTIVSNQSEFGASDLLMNAEGANSGRYGVNGTTHGAGLDLSGAPPPEIGRILSAMAAWNVPPAEVFLPTYFPGTANAQAASRIDLRPGADLRGVDILASPVRTRRVSGMVFNAVTGVAGAAQVTLLAMAPAGLPSPGRGFLSRPTDASSGSFTLTGVSPGSYLLVATAAGGLMARAPIEVGDADVDGVSVTVAPGITVTGRVRLDGQPAGTNATLTGLRIELRPDRPALGVGTANTAVVSGASIGTVRDVALSGGVGPTGEFQVQNIPAGKYRVYVSPILVPVASASVSPDPALPPPPPVAPALQDAFVKSIQLGSVDLLNGGIEIDRAPQGQIEIVIGVNRSALDGRVVSEGREPIPGATVVLLPDPARRARVDLYKSVTTDEAGRFHMAAVPPGDYRLFAWEVIERGAWQNPDFVRVYEDRGTSIHAGDSGTLSVEVPVIRR